MSKRLMPTYLIKFLENLYTGNKPLDFTRVMVTRQFIAKLKELYEDLGGNQPENYTQVLVPKYLQDFFNELEVIEFDDDDISQEKTVPGNLVYPACRIDAIGGMSYKSENLIYAADKPEGTTQGVTYSITDGVVTLNGTSTGVFTIDLTLLQTIPANTPVTLLLGGPSNAPIRLYFFNDDTYVEYYSLNTSDRIINFTKTTQINRCYINIQAGGVFNNQIFKPMLVLGTYSSLDFVQGFAGIRDSIVTKVYTRKSDLSTLPLTMIGAKTYNGSEGGWQYNWNVFHIGFSGFKYRANVVNFKNNLYTEIAYHGSLTDFINAGDKIMTISENTLYVKDSSITSRADFITFLQNNNLDLYYELTTERETPLPEVVSEFVIDTFTVPSAITSLEGYGQGINSTLYNNVDFASGKYIKKVGVVDLGTLNYDYIVQDNVKKRFVATFENNPIGIKPNTFKTLLGTNEYGNQKTPTQAFEDNSGWYIGQTGMGFYTQTITTVEAFKTAMNGVLLYYELTTPVETNITENAPLLEVESGGKVVLDSEYNQDVPSEVVTWIKES